MVDSLFKESRASDAIKDLAKAPPDDLVDNVGITSNGNGNVRIDHCG
jgi:hypothetical protein